MNKLKYTASALALTLAAAVMVAAPLSGTAAADEQSYRNFDIKSQSLVSAIREFSDQADIQVLYSHEVVKQLRTAGLHGRYNPQDGLSRLLRDIGLYIHRADNDTYIIINKLPNDASLVKNISLSATEEDMAYYQENLGGFVEDEEQDKKKEEVEFEEIVVTGSHIRGAGAAGSQVFTYDRGDIDIQGYSTLPQFIQSLPQNFGGGLSESTNGISFANRAGENLNNGTGVNLRGIGNISTLVLLNGQRLSSSGISGDFVDISMIPLSAIERVEVLTDGASAIYGSDAVGGVVNFKLRKDYEGAETRLRYGLATQGGLEEFLVGQTFGTTWEQGHGLISYEYYNRDPLEAKDRSFSQDTPDLLRLLPKQKRHSVFLTGGQKLTDNFKISGTAFYSKRDSESFFTVATFFPVTLSSGESEQFGGSLVTGLELEGNWHAELSGSFNRNETVSGFRAFDEDESEENFQTRASENLSFDVKFDGSLFQLSGGDVKLAIGGHFRQEKFGHLDIGVDPSRIIQQSGNFDRDVYAFFGELHLPLVGETNRMPGVEKLEVSMAGRYEDYNDFGSSTNPKFGVLWSPVEGFDLRGTWGTSFRAPLLRELDESLNSGALFGNISDNIFNTGPLNVLQLAGPGNVNLQPETATTWTAGFDFKPEAISGFNVSVTYFDISYEDRIDAPSPATLNFVQPKFAPFLDFDPDPAFLASLTSPPINNFTTFPGLGPPANFTDTDVIFNAVVQNVGFNTIRGLDFSTSYSLDSGNSGSWNFSLSGTYLFDFIEQFSVADPEFDVVDTIDHPVDLRMIGNISWNYEGFTSNLAVNYIDGYLNDRDDPQTSVDSWTTINLTLSYNTADRFGGILDDTVFTLSAINLFDQDPPFVTTIINPSGINIFYDPSVHSPTGRVLSFQITKKW